MTEVIYQEVLARNKLWNFWNLETLERCHSLYSSLPLNETIFGVKVCPPNHLKWWDSNILPKTFVRFQILKVNIYIKSREIVCMRLQLLDQFQPYKNKYNKNYCSDYKFTYLWDCRETSTITFQRYFRF